MGQDLIESNDYAAWKGWGHGFGEARRGDSQYFRREIREAERAAPISRVLEIGFGNGQFLGYCRRRGWAVMGTELISELVEAARQAGYDAWHAGDLDTLPDDSFDLVVAFDVLEHIPPSEAISFLRTLRRKVRPGGTAVIRVPNVDTWIGNPFQHGDATHVNAIGALKMDYYAGVAGFRVLRMRGTTRRGFRTSMLHGIHLVTAGVLIRTTAAVKKALYFPDLPVVLSSPALVAVLAREPLDETNTKPGRLTG